MISIKKYLDPVAEVSAPEEQAERPPRGENLVTAAIRGYCEALRQMGRCGAEVCPPLGAELTASLEHAADELARAQGAESVAAANERVRVQLENWAGRGARHYENKADEVKNILLVVARTAEAAGKRDERCAQQLHAVTAQLTSIRDLEDVTQIRASIEKSAEELKRSIDRMTAEGKAAVEQLRTEISTYQAKFEEAEQIASRDALTRLGSRRWVEGQIEDRMAAGTQFCVAILDIDGFKRVNDEYGHVAGDELLRQFGAELRAACMSRDVIGRWGGDEFLVVVDCRLTDAEAQMERVSRWVCGKYTIPAHGQETKLRVTASIGVAEYGPGETMKELVERADRAMYRSKVGSRAAR